MNVTKCEPSKYRYEWRKSQQTPMPRMERVEAALVREREAFISAKSNRRFTDGRTSRKQAASIVAPTTVVRGGASVARARARVAAWG